jgi:hypothetical protein
LGSRLDLANQIDNASKFFDFHIQQFSPYLTSTFIKAKKAGLWVPDDRMYESESNINMLMDYLRA